MRVARKGLLAAASLAPGALVVVLAFQGGGFFPLSWTVLATVEAVALALLLVLSPRPLAGLGAAASVAVAALALLGVWMLVSASWSGAPGRALLDFDRLLAYLGLLVLTAALPGGPRRAAWTLRGVAAGLAVVCACALVTRLAPDVWSVDPGPVGDRLAYPVSYWNGLGLMAAAGLVLALHLTASTAEPRWVRVLAAALPAPLACTLYLTFSRGAIGAAVVGVVAYLLLGRPRGLPAALLSAGAATAICVAHAYGATALSTAGTPRADAIAAGHGLGWLLVACCAGAMGVRAALLPLDAALARLRPRPAAGARRAAAALLAASAVAVLVVAVAAGAPAVAERGVQRFLHAPTRSEPDLRGRLLVVSNNGRTDHWRVALDGFERHPWRGTGSGTFATEWNRLRSLPFHVRNAHSLVFETLGELGLVGLGLLALAFGAILAGLARRLRGPGGPVAAAALAAVLTWLVHAAVDWDWQLAAVSVWVFGLAGAVLAVPARGAAGERRVAPGRTLRLLLALAALVLALAPARTAQSQLALERADAAFARGDCAATADAALDSIAAVDQRAEPWELLAYCDVRAGQGELALRAIRNAVARDPGDWQYAYGEALVLASRRRDPRPAAARALALDPLGADARALVRAFRTARPALWERRGRRLRLPEEARG